jgi:hypothetical protein
MRILEVEMTLVDMGIKLAIAIMGGATGALIVLAIKQVLHYGG